MRNDAEQRARRRRPWLPDGTLGNAVLAAVLVVVFLFANLADSGIWDPHELERAELARRIAVHLFGASDLVVDATRDVMPTLSDLGSGELPFVSMALGMSLFGLVDWAGRLPLAVWGAAGALVMFAFLARYLRPKAGLYAVVALVTMPLYFMQARTMLGDIVTMAAFAMAFFGGLALVIESRSSAVAAAWGVVATLGLAAGFDCRGALLGVAAPAVGVAASFGVVRFGGGELPRRLPTRGVGVAAAMLLVSLLALGLGIAALRATGWSSTLVPRLLGFGTPSSAPVSATFDLTLRDLGHALFPWSALLPFAFGRLGWAGGGDGVAGRVARVGLVVGTGAAYVVHASLAPHSGSLPFVATTLLAAVLGVVIADFEHGAPHSALVGFGTATLGLVLLWDLRRMPHKILAVFHLPEGTPMDGFEIASDGALAVVAVMFFVVAWLTWRDPPDLMSGPTAVEALRRWARRRIAHYERALAAMAELSGGNVAFALLVVEAGLVGVALMLVVGRHFGWESVTTMWHPLARAALNLWWVVPLGTLGVVFAHDAARGLFAFVLAWARVPRASAIVVAALVGGAVLCFGDYAALARRLSPKGVFVEYAARRGSAEPLGLIGVDETAARHYAAGARVVRLSGAREAIRWLVAGRRAEPPERRWLVLRHEQLGELNSLFRQTEGTNLPVLGDTSGESLLASNELAGDANDNPLSPFVLQAPPAPIQHPVSAGLGGRVESLGWELRDDRGQLARFAIPGRRFRLTVFYRVVSPLRHDYRAFLHIDGKGRRHNGDHDPVGGRYPSRLWRAGDVIADAHELVLEPNFTPGRYDVYFGLYIGKERLEVRHGPHRDDRVVGGTLDVR